MYASGHASATARPSPRSRLLSGAAATSLALLTLLGGARGRAPQDPPAIRPPEAPFESAFVELSAPRSTCFRGERVPLRLRFGLELEFLAEHALQPFQQQLDVPVQLTWPWLAAPRGALVARPDDGLESEVLAAGALRFVLNDELARGVAVADRVDEARRYRVVELERELRPDRAGRLEVPGPELRVVYAPEFGRDAFGERVASDRREAVVRAASLWLDVRELPEPRPVDFSGGVGAFELRAALDSRRVDAGRAFELTLTLSGSGDLTGVQPPRLAAPGLAVLGRSETTRGDARELRYHLVAGADLATAEVPSIALTFFDPRLEQYRTVRTDPLPFELVVPPGEPTRATSPAPLSEEQRWFRRRLHYVLVAGLLLAALVLVVAKKLTPRSTE